MAHPFDQRRIMGLQRTFAAAERVEHTDQPARIGPDGYRSAVHPAFLLGHGQDEGAQRGVRQHRNGTLGFAEFHHTANVFLRLARLDCTGLRQHPFQAPGRLRLQPSGVLIHQPHHAPNRGQERLQLTDHAVQDRCDIGLAGNQLQRKSAQCLELPGLVLRGQVHGGAGHPHRSPRRIA